MKIRVLLFAGAKVAVQAEYCELALEPGSTVGQLKRRLGDEFPRLRGLLARSAIAVDRKIALDQAPIEPHNEIAVIPPVSGG